MKKQYLAVAFLAVALGITACSSKKADTESTTAQAVESTEATSDEEVEEFRKIVERGAPLFFKYAREGGLKLA